MDNILYLVEGEIYNIPEKDMKTVQTTSSVQNFRIVFLLLCSYSVPKLSIFFYKIHCDKNGHTDS